MVGDSFNELFPPGERQCFSETDQLGLQPHQQIQDPRVRGVGENPGVSPTDPPVTHRVQHHIEMGDEAGSDADPASALPTG